MFLLSVPFKCAFQVLMNQQCFTCIAELKGLQFIYISRILQCSFSLLKPSEAVQYKHTSIAEAFNPCFRKHYKRYSRGTNILSEDSRKNRKYSVKKQEDQDDFLQRCLCWWHQTWLKWVDVILTSPGFQFLWLPVIFC